MPTITLTTTKVERITKDSTILIFDGKPTPTLKGVPVTTVDDCKKALADYVEALKSKPVAYHVSVFFDKGSGRKPKGFDKADDAHELEALANAHLAPHD